MSELEELGEEFAPHTAARPIMPRCEYHGGFLNAYRCPSRASVRVDGRGYCRKHAKLFSAK